MQKRTQRRVGLISALGFLATGATFLATHRDAHASVVETQYVSVDATACVAVTGTVQRNAHQVQSTSAATYTLRCPVDFNDSSGYPATITGLTGNGFWNAPSPIPGPPTLQVTLYRRQLSSTTRSVVATCTMTPTVYGYDQPHSCTQAVSTTVDDVSAAYYVEFTTTINGLRWGSSGATISYQWVNGP